ncbi:hypothetical protein GCM10009092_05220 [Bowmanella denitrificans]|uniref:Type II secretion system protein N n=1 Tax=Bowmanella denitrificans TaxID=366582 RepID=A0ABP3GGX6_9ALTE
MKFVKILGLSLLAYLLLLIASLPAAQVVPRLPLPPQLQIQGLQGSIWNGRAAIVQYQGLPVRQLHWQVNPWALLTGKLSLALNAGNSRDVEQISLQGHLRLGNNSIASEGLEIFLPTDLVIAQLPLPLPVNAKGRFKVNLDELEYDQSGCHSAVGRGQWLNAQVSGTRGFIPLGNFSADLSCQDKQLLLDIKEPNSFGLNAQARIPADFKVKVTGRFKPSAELPEEVHQAARLFGQADNQGYYQIRF